MNKQAAPCAFDAGRAQASNGDEAEHNARVRIVAIVDVAGASPHEIRERFAQAIREAVERAWSVGRIDLPIAEELIRTLPARGHA